MNAFLTWAEARLGEASTWRGLVGLLTAAGVSISPHMAVIIIAGGMGLAGFIGVVTADPKNVAADVQAAVQDVVVPVVEAATTNAVIATK